MVDIKSFLTRRRMSKADLCRELGIDAKSNLISSYEKGRISPSYDKCVQLLQLGMTVKELFGIDLPSDSQNRESLILTDEELSRAFRRAADILNQSKKENG